MNKKLLLIFVLAFFLRILLVFSAHHGDLNNNISWGTIAAKKGLIDFYGSEKAEDWPFSAPNQPPLTILMFAGVRKVWLAIENISWWLNNNLNLFPSPFIWFWEQKGMVLLIKLPGILADLTIAWIIHQYLREQGRKERKAILLTAVWLFNPVSWYNSSVWGQTDSVVNLLGFVSIFSLLNKNLVLSSVFFVLSFLFKGSLAIFTPILVLIAISQRYKLHIWAKSFAYCLVTVAFISFWFHPELDLFPWLINLYKNRILPGEIGYLTANAFNFWWLVNPGKVPDSTVFFGLPTRVWGIGITLLGILGVLSWLSKEKLSDKRIFVSLVLVSLITFLSMTRVHERYLYPFFPYATVLLGFVPQLTGVYVVLSLTHLLNLYHLFWVPPMGFIENLFTKPIFPVILSLTNIFAFVYLLRLLRTSKI